MSFKQFVTFLLILTSGYSMAYTISPPSIWTSANGRIETSNESVSIYIQSGKTTNAVDYYLYESTDGINYFFLQSIQIDGGTLITANEGLHFWKATAIDSSGTESAYSQPIIELEVVVIDTPADSSSFSVSLYNIGVFESMTHLNAVLEGVTESEISETHLFHRNGSYTRKLSEHNGFVSDLQVSSNIPEAFVIVYTNDNRRATSNSVDTTQTEEEVTEEEEEITESVEDVSSDSITETITITEEDNTQSSKNGGGCFISSNP